MCECDCELVMIWKERFSAKPAMEHTFEKIEILIEGLNTVMNYAFNENDTEIEYELRTLIQSKSSSGFDSTLLDLLVVGRKGKIYQKKITILLLYHLFGINH